MFECTTSGAQVEVADAVADVEIPVVTYTVEALDLAEAEAPPVKDEAEVAAAAALVNDTVELLLADNASVATQEEFKLKYGAASDGLLLRNAPASSLLGQLPPEHAFVPQQPRNVALFWFSYLQE